MFIHHFVSFSVFLGMAACFAFVTSLLDIGFAKRLVVDLGRGWSLGACAASFPSSFPSTSCKNDSKMSADSSSDSESESRPQPGGATQRLSFIF